MFKEAFKEIITHSLRYYIISYPHLPTSDVFNNFSWFDLFWWSDFLLLFHIKKKVLGCFLGGNLGHI